MSSSPLFSRDLVPTHEGACAGSTGCHCGICHQNPDPPSSSLLSPVISTDSDSEAREVRLEEAAEVTLACLLPGSRLTQCSHREELVEPAEKEAGVKVKPESPGPACAAHTLVKGCRLGCAWLMSSPPGRHSLPDPMGRLLEYPVEGGEEDRLPHTCAVIKSKPGDGYSTMQSPSPKGWQQNGTDTVVNRVT